MKKTSDMFGDFSDIFIRISISGLL